MSKYSALIKRASNATAALALTLASLTPAVMLGGSAKAAQLTARSVEMSDSEQDALNVKYTVKFTVPAGSAGFSSIKVEFCSNSPVQEVACTASSLDTDPAATNPAIDGTSDAGWTVGAGTDANVLVLNKTGAAGAHTVAVTGINNPTTATVMYAKIFTKSAADDGGSVVDYGAVAMMTTDDITINARVQETLTFCVGADDTTAIGLRSDCTGITSQLVDLGVVGTTLTHSPVTSADPIYGNEQNGFFVLQTNATSGANVKYFGRTELKVAGATCNANAIDDQCFNNSDGVGAVVAATEEFGMYIDTIDQRGATTIPTELQEDSEYSGANDKWSTSLDTVATANSPVDWDVAELRFKATTATTTPSGFYTTQANFIATGLF